MAKWYRQEKTPDSSTRVRWQSYQQSHIAENREELTKEMMNLALRSIFIHTPQESLTCCKILHRSDGFASPSKGRRAADFYRPRPGLNPRTLGSMASTLTITPPRTWLLYFQLKQFKDKQLTKYTQAFLRSRRRQEVLPGPHCLWTSVQTMNSLQTALQLPSSDTSNHNFHIWHSWERQHWTGGQSWPAILILFGEGWLMGRRGGIQASEGNARARGGGAFIVTFSI
jgi:hypothetical protein